MAELHVLRHRVAELEHAISRVEHSERAGVDGQGAGREQTLPRHEQQLRESQGLADLGSWEYDLTTGRLAWSDAMYQLHGLTRETFTGDIWKHGYACLHPDDRAKAMASVEHTRRDGGKSEIEFRLVLPDGSQRMMRGRAMRIDDETGHPVRLIGTMQDITEQKRVEVALRTSEELNRRILEALPGGLVQVSVEGAVLFANDQARQLLGLAYDELTSRYVADFAPQTFWEDGSPCPVEQYPVTKCLQTGRPQPPVTIGVRHRDGTMMWALFTAVPVLDLETGRPNGAVVTFLDLTPRKEAEQERECLISELEAKNAELERFTYTVSHDLKTPLMTIKGFLGMLEKDTLSGNHEAMRRDIAHINTAADRMARLLSELLELSRIGRLVNPAEVVSFPELIQEAVDLFQVQIAERGIEVKRAPVRLQVSGDRTRLLEMMQNLIDNAVKYMGHQPAPSIEIGGRQEGAEVICYVRDNGIGINPRYHEKVFGLFERLDTGEEGTGVGLTLVKRIVEVHGGRIWIESAGNNTGSTFWFALPLESADD